jgi:Na+/proline symporter
LKKLEQSTYRDSLKILQQQYDSIGQLKQQTVVLYADARHAGESVKAEAAVGSLLAMQKESDSLRKKVVGWLNKKIPGGDGNDTNYIFLRFVVDHLPVGLVGLLIAIIFLASWGSIAAAINSLASCSMVDFHRRFSKKTYTAEQEYRLSKWYTLGWGVFCIIVAMFTYNIGNSLIEAVNILGSLFYGVILGVFLVAFFMQKVTDSTVVFWAAILAQILVLAVFIMTRTGVFKMGFLWLNPIGAFGVVGMTWLLGKMRGEKLMEKG